MNNGIHSSHVEYRRFEYLYMSYHISVFASTEEYSIVIYAMPIFFSLFPAHNANENKYH